MSFSELIYSQAKLNKNHPVLSLGTYIHKLDREPSLNVFYMFVLSAVEYFNRQLNNSELSHILETTIQKSLWDVLIKINV